MFDIRLLHGNTATPFDRHLPIFNWPYPFDRDEDLNNDNLQPYTRHQVTAARRRAVYIHIPFCNTICSFCPFSRDIYRSEDDVQIYLDALIAEMEMKHSLFGRIPIDTIFVGGGTPSILTVKQIERLSSAILAYFDTTNLREFTFEVEVKSISEGKVKALVDAGVNRVSFGVQTFSKRYRDLFSLSSTVKEVVYASNLLGKSFNYTNADLLYGMAGQTIEEVYQDLVSIVSLETTTIDIYPINNLSASNRMHRNIKNSKLDYLPASVRLDYRVQLGAWLREFGYAPISGYGFARASKQVSRWDGPVQHSPKFLYHDLVYGYHDDEIIGYGASAFSLLQGYNLYNFSSRNKYIRAVMLDRRLPQQCFGEISSPERGIVLFPFRGELDKSKVPWARVPEETLISLQAAINADLVVDCKDHYELTNLGWVFYVNLMYYLMPVAGKEWISKKILQLESMGRRCGDPQLNGLGHLVRERQFS